MELFEFNWQCQRCNACCTKLGSGVPVLLKDVRRIARYRNMTPERFAKEFCDYELVVDKAKEIEIPLLTLKLVEGTCTLFGGGGCSVHNIKPYYCKAAPVISIMFAEKENHESFKQYCEGYGKGRRYTIEDIKTQLRIEQRLEEEDVAEMSRAAPPFISLQQKQEIQNDTFPEAGC